MQRLSGQVLQRGKVAEAFQPQARRERRQGGLRSAKSGLEGRLQSL